MKHDIALFLDLDNIVIGASEANLPFDVNLILDHVKKVTSGRVVLRRAYADWRQSGRISKDLATAGFELQSAVRLGNTSKNLADMQMVVDVMETLIDGHDFNTYVFITGDRDFLPLVQTLRKRGRHVIGIGVRHTASGSLKNLCDEFIYYEDLIYAAYKLDLPQLIEQSLTELLSDQTNQIAAGIFKEHINKLTKGAFNRSPFGRKSFRQLLEEFPELVNIKQEGSTIFVSDPKRKFVEQKNGHQPHNKPAIERNNPKGDVEELLNNALDILLVDSKRIRASQLKQQMQTLSQNQFNEKKLGDKNFSTFLKRHNHIVRIVSENSTWFVSRETVTAKTDEIDTNNQQPKQKPEPELTITDAIKQVSNKLFKEHPHVRINVFQEQLNQLAPNILSKNNTKKLNTTQFLQQYPDLIQLVQHKDTVTIYPPGSYTEPINMEEIAASYRVLLKKVGFRIIPKDKRVNIIKSALQRLAKGSLLWKDLVANLVEQFEKTDNPISKSMVNDVLRIAKKADIICLTETNGTLSTTPMKLNIGGKNALKEGIMRADAAYIITLQELEQTVELPALAQLLYDDPSYERYLTLIMQKIVPKAHIK